jgi:hypothetical protein
MNLQKFTIKAHEMLQTSQQREASVSLIEKEFVKGKWEN